MRRSSQSCNAAELPSSSNQLARAYVFRGHAVVAVSAHSAWPALLAVSREDPPMTVVGCTGHQNIPTEAIEYVKEHLIF